MKEEVEISLNLFVLVFIAGLLVFTFILKLETMSSILSSIMFGAIALASRFLYQKNR